MIILIINSKGLLRILYLNVDAVVILWADYGAPRDGVDVAQVAVLFNPHTPAQDVSESG